jgi:hypothetical protein
VTDAADTKQSESRLGDSAAETGTVAAIGSPDIGTPADHAGFAPLDNPPRLDGVELIGVPDPPEPMPLQSEPAGVSSDAPESEGELDEGTAPPTAPVFFAISADLIQRAKEIALETERIDIDVAGIVKINGILGADEATLEQEE